MKRLICAAILTVGGLGAGPVRAMTQPDDIVRMIVSREEQNLPAAHYSKKWKDINLSPQSKAALLNLNQKLDQDEKYHIGFLMLGGDQLQRVAFYGEDGAVTMMTWPQGIAYGEVCTLRFDSNGGFAGLQKQACKPF